MELIIGLVIGLVIGAVGGIFGLLRRQTATGAGKISQAEATAKQVLQAAELESEKVISRAEKKAQQQIDEADKTITRRRRELDKEDDRLQKRRGDLDARFERLESREGSLNKRQSSLDRKENQLLSDLQKEKEELGKEKERQQQELEVISRMTVDEAREALMQSVERDARNDMARIIRQVEAEARDQADRKAREIISMSIQRLASEHVSEISVSVVSLPSDDMKGRIIGRSGRNIRSFEMAAGVDVVVDDTPEAVTISSFDPVRREVAKRALSKLVQDGRIHPARIEKLVEDTKAEVEGIIVEEGERAAYETGVHGLHPEVTKLLGRLKFRTSYGQNQHAHAIETAHIAGMIAAELGADVDIAKAGGLLHDIGKAIDHDHEGTHAGLGAEFIKRYGVNEKVVNCVASHHHEVEQTCVEAYIVEAADAISGARPGARRESLDSYIKRVKSLEEIANGYDGVEHSYALQAGREVRIIVRPEKVDELSALELARDVAKQIEDTMQYPGQIKVHVIRETRAIEFAK